VIVRTWSCSVLAEEIAAVADHIERTGLVECRAIDGYLGGWLLKHDDVDHGTGRLTLTLVTCWRSRESIEHFAGPVPSRAVLYEEDRAFDLRSELTVQHYELLRRDAVPEERMSA
jgi:heme-degrading monooxygenase HmoA